MKTKAICRDCGVELNDENWSPAQQKNQSNICRDCECEYQKQWQKANPDKVRETGRRWREANREKSRAASIRYIRRRGAQPFNENKECALYLGVHIAEQILSQAFKNVERMPYGNPGFDLICNKGKIDVKSSTLHEKKKNAKSWDFHIRHNSIPDFFLCLAFDNREDLIPLHAWLLPGSKFNQFIGITISVSTIHKWDAYRLDITKISQCCDAIR